MRSWRRSPPEPPTAGALCLVAGCPFRVDLVGARAMSQQAVVDVAAAVLAWHASAAHS